MPTKFDRLQALLVELFQLDQADLDFGIYRIMNLRREEITRFLTQERLPQVRAALAGQGAAGRGELEAELRRPEVTAAIVGARSPWQIEEVAKAGDWRLTAQELAEIETLLTRRAQVVA